MKDLFVDYIPDEVISQIIVTSFDMIDALENEEYEKADMIKMSNTLFLNRQAQHMSEANQKPLNENLKNLSLQAEVVFRKLNSLKNSPVEMWELFKKACTVKAGDEFINKMEDTSKKKYSKILKIAVTALAGVAIGLALGMLAF